MSEATINGGTVFQKIHAIQNKLPKLKKEGTNSFHKYNYVTEAQFVDAILPLLDQHGLVVIPELAAPPSMQELEGGKILTTIMMKFKLVNKDDDKDYVQAIIPAQGIDNGDKGVYKAITGAKKYFLANTFMISTGDDPEKDTGFVKKAGKGKLTATSTF